MCNIQAIGDKCAPLKRMVHESVSWAKLEPAGESAISTFIELLDKSEGKWNQIHCHTHYIVYNFIINFKWVIQCVHVLVSV